MKVLVACEESQRVCIEFRKLGHEAYSCDIEPCSGGHPEWHIQNDVLPLLNGNCEFQTVDGITHRIDRKWDLIIAHPPCTYLSNAGAAWLYPKKGILNQERYEQGLKAKEFFMQFYNADCEKIAIENPVPTRVFELPRYNQIIQPYEFGHPYSKKTCLWLKGLPKLKSAEIVSGEITPWVSSGSGYARGKSGTNFRDAKTRAKTFPGIAKAMAEQWGNIEVKSEPIPSNPMKCSELKPNDAVVFYVTVYAGGKEEVYDGNVIYVDNNAKSVCVCYLEGYKSRNDIIPFEKMIAKADENGEEMLFGGWIIGKSVLLQAELEVVILIDLYPTKCNLCGGGVVYISNSRV